MNIVAFTILADGIPIIYEGQEQHYSAVGGSGAPYNREAMWLSNYDTEATLYRFIKTLNAIRTYATSVASGPSPLSTSYSLVLGNFERQERPSRDVNGMLI